MVRSRLTVGCLLAVLLATALGSETAAAFTALTLDQRRRILQSAEIHAPNDKVLRDPACVAGRLSTVDPRWAMVFLTNTKACVSRYGGASGESVLLERSSGRAVDWRIVGSVSEHCVSHEAGAPNRVLRDLGCASFGPPPAQRLRLAGRHASSGRLITPHGVGALHSGRLSGPCTATT